jgi:hypothetical protein
MAQMNQIYDFIDQFNKGCTTNMSVSSYTTKQINQIDDFGRDASYRKSKAFIAYEIFAREITELFKGKSWAEVQWELEDQEEEEEQNYLRSLDQSRKQQFMFGNYEHEEGEIFE